MLKLKKLKPIVISEKFHEPQIEPMSTVIEIEKGETLVLKCSGMSNVKWMKMKILPLDPFSEQVL